LERLQLWTKGEHQNDVDWIKGKLLAHWFGEFASFVGQLMLVVVVFFFHYTNSYLGQCVRYF